MNGFAALLRKELLELFATPVVFVVAGVFWLASGTFFTFSLLFLRAGDMVNGFHNLTLLLLLMAPLLTMRSVAEETSRGTIELLFALPLGVATLVAAKFVALLCLLLALVAGSAAALIPLALYAQPDWGPIVGGYLGLVLFGAAVLAMGLAVSCCVRSQMAAAVVTWGLLLWFWFADYGAVVASGEGAGALAAGLRHLSFSLHARTLIRGVLDLSTAVYFLSCVLVSTVLAVQVLRWRRA